MYNAICDNCQYQRFGFLSKYDTICPFGYDFRECYTETKGEINEIRKYDKYYLGYAGDNNAARK